MRMKKIFDYDDLKIYLKEAPTDATFIIASEESKSKKRKELLIESKEWKTLAKMLDDFINAVKSKFMS